MNLKFLKCNKCKNILVYVDEKCSGLTCCGEELKELVPGTVEASLEKHIPVYEQIENAVNVTVGSVLHPMQPEHYIEWICIQTSTGYQLKYLNPGDEPKASFALTNDEKLEAVYAYCNLHGLWKSTI